VLISSEEGMFHVAIVWCVTIHVAIVWCVTIHVAIVWCVTIHVATVWCVTTHVQKCRIVSTEILLNVDMHLLLPSPYRITTLCVNRVLLQVYMFRCYQRL